MKGPIKWLKDAAKKADQIVAEEAPRPDKPAPKPEPKPDAPFIRGLGERLGFAGIVAVTIGAALFGAVGCNEGTDTSPATASCDEPATWCTPTATAVTR